MWYLRMYRTGDIKEAHKGLQALVEASRAFTSKSGRPQLPEDIMKHTMVGWDARDPRYEYRYLRVQDKDFATFLREHKDKYLPLRLRESWQYISVQKRREIGEELDIG
jgi:hypothetical protein